MVDTFLYNDSKELVFSNLDKICLENSWTLEEIVCFDKEISETIRCKLFR